MGEIVTGALRHIGTLAIDAVVGGFQAIGGAISDGIADAKNYAIIAAQTDAVIKSTGGAAGVSAEHVAEYAGALSDAAGASLFGDDQVQEASNLILTFTNIKGAVVDTATSLSVDMAQALGGEPKAQAIALGKALNDPIKGVTALTRVGVTFTEQQKAQIQALQESGDMMGAQAIITDELTKEFGGSAQAAADATGGWSEFNGRMGEAKEALGTALLPLLNQLAGVLLTTVMPAIEGLAAQFGPLIESLGPIVAQVQASIGGLMASFSDTSAVDTFTGASAALGAFWSTQLKPAFDAVWVVLQTQVWPILQDLATALFPLVGAAIQILSGFWTDVLVPALQTFWEFLTTVILPIIAALAGWLKDNLPGAIQAVADFLTGTLFPAFHKIYDFISANVIPVIQTVAKWLIENVPVAIQKASDFWNNVLWPALQKVWAFIQDNVIPILTEIVTETFAALNTAVQEVSTFWTETLWPALQKVWAFIQDNVIPILKSLVDNALVIVKREVGALATLWSDTLWPALQKVWAFINDNIIPIFKTLVDTHIKALKDGFQGLATFWNDTFVPAMEKVYGFIYNTLGPQLATLNTNVLEPMAGFFSSIATAISDLIGWIDSFIAKIAEVVIPDWLEGHSPPPMANWFSDIAASTAAATMQLSAFQGNLAVAAGPVASNVANTNTSSRSFTYAPQYNTNGALEGPMDLAMATSLAGV